MENKKGLLIIVAALVVLLGVGTVGYRYLSNQYQSESLTALENEQETTLAAAGELEESAEEVVVTDDFTVYNKDGEAVKLSDYIGKKPVVVNFWASWCPPCKAEMPFFQDAVDQYGDDVEILMINLTDGMREKIEDADQYIEAEGYRMKVLYDTEMDAAATYRVQGIPRSLFVDIDGQLQYDHVGMITQELLNENIDQILN